MGERPLSTRPHTPCLCRISCGNQIVADIHRTARVTRAHRHTSFTHAHTTRQAHAAIQAIGAARDGHEIMIAHRTKRRAQHDREERLAPELHQRAHCPPAWLKIRVRMALIVVGCGVGSVRLFVCLPTPVLMFRHGATSWNMSLDRPETRCSIAAWHRAPSSSPARNAPPYLSRSTSPACPIGHVSRRMPSHYDAQRAAMMGRSPLRETSARAWARMPGRPL